MVINIEESNMPNQNETQDEDLEKIYLMAAGYEWECPNCAHLNREIEIMAKVACSNCSKDYEVMDADHAWE